MARKRTLLSGLRYYAFSAAASRWALPWLISFGAFSVVFSRRRVQGQHRLESTGVSSRILLALGRHLDRLLLLGSLLMDVTVISSLFSLSRR